MHGYRHDPSEDFAGFDFSSHQHSGFSIWIACRTWKMSIDGTDSVSSAAGSGTLAASNTIPLVLIIVRSLNESAIWPPSGGSIRSGQCSLVAALIAVKRKSSPRFF